MKPKVLSVILCLAMILSLPLLLASCTTGNGQTDDSQGGSNETDQPTDGQLEYALNESGDAYYVASVGTAGNQKHIVIDATYNGLPVIGIGCEAFAWSKGIEHITVPEGVTYIEDEAFSGCSSMKTLDLPSSITSIGEAAFAGCNITVTEYENGRYIGNDSNKYVCLVGVIDPTVPTFTVANGTKVIYSELFQYNKALTAISIPQDLTDLGTATFEGCTNLTDITIPASLLSVKDSTFKDCAGITSIALPEGLTSIGEKAFWGCSELQDLTLPQSTVSIGNDAFANIPYGDSDENGWYFGNETNPYLFLRAVQKNVTSFSVPEGTVFIGEGAFGPCSKTISSITFSSTVKHIRSDVLKGCDNLYSLHLPEGLLTIGDHAFMRNENLETVDIPASVVEIGKYVFEGCSGLKTLLYQGTVQEWEAIKKHTDWCSGASVTVQCTDGVA